ncbi:MAG: BON domain-containing protein [Desulfatiglandales bacterium]
MDTMMKRIFILLVGSVVLFGLLACHTPAGRSAGEVVDDSVITTKVKSKLFEDGQLSGFAISVKTFQGVVTLTGAVDTADEKEHASKVALSVTGVNKVNNVLEIKPKGK